MPPEIVGLIENPYLLIVVLLVGPLAGYILGTTVERVLSDMQRRAWRERNRWRWQRKRSGSSGEPKSPISPKPTDAADQLRIVMGANFSARPLLNKSEARLFKELDRIVIGCNPGWQVMAQVSLGEVLRSRDADAYSCINSKRVDLLLMDENCRPRHVIEYQGAAHHRGAAAARDAVKKEALRRAGIGYHEIFGGRTKPSELSRLVEELVDQPMEAHSQSGAQSPRMSVTGGHCETSPMGAAPPTSGAALDVSKQQV